MKKFLAMLMALAMVLSIVTIPVIAETEEPKTSSAKFDSSQNSAPQTASTLNEALNVPGGSLNFVTEGDYPWFVYGDAAKSSNINIGDSTSTVSTTVTASAGDVLRFDYMSFGEGFGYDPGSYVMDGLQLFIDGSLVYDRNRAEVWESYSTSLEEGEHTIEWTYKKDSSYDEPGDYAILDNVYVGEPIPPTSVEVQDITVPVDRVVGVQYILLPVDTHDKSAAFEIADETIATVDENGLIRGVAEGTTTITVTVTTSYGSATGTANVTVTEALPSAELIGYIFDEQAGYSYWGSFSEGDPSTIENLGSAPITYGAASAGRMIYGFNGDNEWGVITDGRFYIIDTTVGMTPVFTGYSADRIIVDMAFDYTSNTLYAIAYGSGSGRSLFTVNRALGTLTEVAAFDIPETIHTFAIDENGVGYGISNDTSTLYRIDLETAHCDIVGPTGVEMKYVQSMTYDMNTHQLFWAQYSDASSGLYYVDRQTGNVTPAGVIGGGAEVTCLLTLNDIEVPDPELPEFTVTFVDNFDNSTISSMAVEVGTVLNESDFPNPPTHAGYEFTGWDYNGTAVDSDIIIRAKYRNPSAANATIIFEVDEVWSDGSGYQMLLDADALSYGYLFPAAGPLTGSGSAPEGLYDEFEYKLPENADGNLNTSNVICGGSATIEIPAGIYDWVITNPTPNSGIWIASEQGSIGGRADDFEFEAGMTYKFHVYHSGMYDATDLIITHTPTTGIPGDANGDGVVDTLDAVMVMRHALSLITLSDEAIALCDMNGDGEITILDATLIMRAALGF